MEQTITVENQHYLIQSRILLWGSKKPFNFEIVRVDSLGRGIEQVVSSTTRYMTSAEGIEAGARWLQKHANA